MNESTKQKNNKKHLQLLFAETFINIYNILYLCDKPGYTLDTTT